MNLKMKSKDKLCKEYGLKKERLDKIIWDCFRWHLSEEELQQFIWDYYMRLERKLNRRECCP